MWVGRLGLCDGHGAFFMNTPTIFLLLSHSVTDPGRHPLFFNPPGDPLRPRSALLRSISVPDRLRPIPPLAHQHLVCRRGSVLDLISLPPDREDHHPVQESLDCVWHRDRHRSLGLSLHGGLRLFVPVTAPLANFTPKALYQPGAYERGRSVPMLTSDPAVGHVRRD